MFKYICTYITLNDLNFFIRFIGFICHTILSVFIYIHVHVAGHFTQLIHPFSYLVKHPYLGCDDDYKMPCRSHFDRDYLQTFKKMLIIKLFTNFTFSTFDRFLRCLYPSFSIFSLKFFSRQKYHFWSWVLLKTLLEQEQYS